jgi:hypothetical protein
MNDHSEQDAPRIRIGPVASQLARQKSGGPTFTQAHLEDAIAELQAVAGSLRLGPIATQLAREKAGFEQVTELVLDQAIEDLMSRAKEAGNNTIPAPALDQLQLINENIIRLRHMILATNPVTDGDVQRGLELLRSTLATDQIERGKYVGLDVEKLAKMEDQGRIFREENVFDPKSKPELDADMER